MKRYDAVNKFGQPAIQWAAIKSSADLCRYLIKNGADITFKDCRGTRLLHAACAGGHRNLCTMLIDQGA